MSHRAVNWAYGLSIHPHGAKFVLVTLADEANNDGEVWRGQRGLAERCCMVERAVRGHLSNLEQMGLISRAPRFRKDGTRNSDIITLNLDHRQILPAAKNNRDHRQILPGIRKRNRQLESDEEKEVIEEVVVDGERAMPFVRL